MIFTVGVKASAYKDVENMLQPAPPGERLRIAASVQFLIRVELREDPHLKGEGSPADPSFRKLARGSVEVFYRVRPLDDRYTVVEHFRRLPATEQP